MSIDEQQRPELPTHAASHEGTEVVLWGFWAFMMSDALVFALLFATYGVLRHATAGGPGPAELYELESAGIQTLVLLTSSFTFGMASLSMRAQRNRGALLGWLGVTLLLGLLFLCLELRDFVNMIAQGAGPARSGFLSAFFALLSTHGLHVFFGALWMVVSMAQIVRLGLDAQVRSNVLRLGLFWHFLDIVWVGILSVVYLQGLIT